MWCATKWEVDADSGSESPCRCGSGGRPAAWWQTQIFRSSVRTVLATSVVTRRSKTHRPFLLVQSMCRRRTLCGASDIPCRGVLAQRIAPSSRYGRPEHGAIRCAYCAIRRRGFNDRGTSARTVHSLRPAAERWRDVAAAPPAGAAHRRFVLSAATRCSRTSPDGPSTRRTSRRRRRRGAGLRAIIVD